ncbi:FAD-binding domain-containing protein [Delitschia confertaspora ATCC 74209]|uniref:FAD-binding domain-containing protein n=1 Tax=Delitschia confertaspora ATCC 74209 TaxID=1513339 RepID=A0A9P4JL62_9PLEO|nr:FAD-binding domain-containing protein [Delitschia confertaspora ATCC 74209]
MAPFATLLLATSFLSGHSLAKLFAFEKVQLTEKHLDSLSDEDASLFAFQYSAAAKNSTPARCRVFPGDNKWPSEKGWAKLSRQLSTPNGLIATVPQAAPCYPGQYQNAAKCQQMTANWTNSYTHIDDPTEILSPMYQGITCEPPAVFDSNTCTLGGYPSYVINAKTVLDIQLGINFARNNGLRLVIKNTGHDFAGKSTGAGALSIWTHNLKDVTFYDNYVDDSGYKGPALKGGAGLQSFDLYKAANDHGVVVVGGEGQTVGVMGGCIQGGCHSPLSSLYGMGADNVLGFEVVTPTGEFVTANSTSNQDLFWALRGGGGGTFGVVTSVTVKAYPDFTTTAATWMFDSITIGRDKFWAATRAYFDRIIPNVDAGIYSLFILAPNGSETTFISAPFFAPNKTSAQVSTLLNPYFSALKSLGVTVTPQITQYKGFYPAWRANFALEPMSEVSNAGGSRLFPRSNFVSETGRNISFGVIQASVQAGSQFIGFNEAPTLARGGNVDNSVNPAWRNTVLHAITGKQIDMHKSAAEILAARATFTNGTLKSFRDVTVGSGTYLNEADRLEPDWQNAFWGDKYKRLLSIKKEVDTKDVLWAIHAVGSEGWVVESVNGLPNENGRLCRVNGTTV